MPAIEKLLLVRGFDIPIAANAEFERLRASLSQAAEALGLELVDVATNLRAVRFREAEWGRLSHGSALASVGLAAERGFQSLCIAATHYDGPVKPWGSQPETDPLLSTGITRIFHVGLLIPRREKTEYISSSEVAMRHLHVCYRLGSADNCCDCKMPSGDAHPGSRGSPRSLPALAAKEPRPRARATARIDSRPYCGSIATSRPAPARAGRKDVADAIASCLRRSRRMKPVMAALEWGGLSRGIGRISRRCIVGSSRAPQRRESPDEPGRGARSAATVVALAALVAGLAVGIFVHGSGDPALRRVVDAVGVIGQLWVCALSMTVLPLVIAMTLGPSSARNEKIDRDPRREAFVLFVAMLMAASCLTLAIATPTLASHVVDPVAAASFRAQMSEPATAVLPDGRAAMSVRGWLVGLVPINVFSSAARGEILPILVFTVLFGLGGPASSPGGS